MELKTIPRNQREKLLKTFLAIENSLSLHYTNHLLSPLLTKVLDSASTLAGFKIVISDFEKLLYFGQNLYIINRIDTNLIDFSKIYVKFPTDFKDTNFEQRKNDFIKNLDQKLIQDHLPSIPIQSMFSSTKPLKIVKKSPIKKRLVNESSKFRFIEKNELIEQQKNQGLTLLERIRLKENSTTVKADPKIAYQKYLSGKTKTIYDIIYQSMVNEKLGLKSFSMNKLTENIKDSLSYPQTSEEIEDVIKLIVKTFNRDTFILVERDGVLVLRVGKLSREEDLKLLGEVSGS